MKPLPFPAAVPQLPLRYAVRRLNRPVKEVGIVTAFHDGVVTLRVNRRVDGFHESANNDGYVGVKAGDLVVHGLDLVHGAVGVSDSDGQITPVCWVLEPRMEFSSGFLAFALQSVAATGYVRANAKGVRSAGADFRRWESLAEIPIPAPGLEYQRQAAALLECERDRIKAAVASLETLAARTTEQADEVLERVLLDLADRHPGRKVAWDARILGGFAFKSEAFVHDPSAGVRLLRGTNLTPAGTRWESVVYWPHERRSEAQRFELRAGDLIVGLNRPWVKGGLRTAIIDEADLPALLLQRVACLRPHLGSALQMRYLQLWLRTRHFRTTVRDDSAVTFPMLEPGRLLSYRLPVPAADEQASAVRLSDSTRSRVVRVQAEARVLTENLQTYWRALRLRAVTGRLEPAQLTDRRMDENLAMAREGEAPEVLAS